MAADGGGRDSAEVAKHAGGRPKDLRPELTIRLPQESYDELEAMQGETGLAPRESAGMLLHMLMRNPDTIASRLKALRNNEKAPD